MQEFVFCGNSTSNLQGLASRNSQGKLPTIILCCVSELVGLFESMGYVATDDEVSRMLTPTTMATSAYASFTTLMESASADGYISLPY
jgi:hypothetical protein